jgi:Zn-dependent protease with chaperone function
MERPRAGATRGLSCPECGGEIDGDIGAGAAHGEATCPRCGASLPQRRPRPDTARAAAGGSHVSSPPGWLMLACRNWLLRLLERAYWTGTFTGSVILLACGGFVPVIRGWLRNEIHAWSDVVAAVGGVWFAVQTLDPDSDLGPVLARVDAPLLFSTIDSVGRRLGIKPPGQIRLTYLPCCGVVAWGRSRALIIGLPLFRVLTQGELRAIVAHELAHIARGDATRAVRSARFVEALEQAVTRNGPRVRGPLGAWSRFCLREASRLIEPVARGQEVRADRLSASIAGGSAAASALVKVAVVQPLFREVLGSYDPNDSSSINLYAFFRAFWYRLPSEVHSAMRLSVLTRSHAAYDPAHPPLPDRIAALQSYSDPASLNGDTSPATTFLGDLEIFEQMLHNRLFGVPSVEPSVFHRAGS